MTDEPFESGGVELDVDEDYQSCAELTGRLMLQLAEALEANGRVDNRKLLAVPAMALGQVIALVCPRGDASEMIDEAWKALRPMVLFALVDGLASQGEGG